MMLKQCVQVVSRSRQTGKGKDPGVREHWSLTPQKGGWGYKILNFNKN